MSKKFDKKFDEFRNKKYLNLNPFGCEMYVKIHIVIHRYCC